MKRIWKIAAATIVLLLAVWGVVLLAGKYGGTPEKTTFILEKIVRTDLARSISATGTVEPEELINVGAQVNGKIMNFGSDLDGNRVDFGSKVTKGMMLAQIDDVTYKAELQEVQASKEQAEASILSAEAAIKEAEANALLAKNNWERAQTLFQQKSMTRSDFDSYEAQFYTAGAQQAKANAALAQARASLSIANASLVKAERNLEYCVISSPVDGIIIDRRVSVGQTVVSNQSASSIFLVAKDFARMQVWVSVNEADIGSIYPGMKVRFSCDAFPGTEFHGEVFRIRLNATLSSNVVTYIVEVNADNQDRKLIPYLTANVKFIIDEHKQTLAVSPAVFRYSPPAELRGETPVVAEKGGRIVWLHSPDGSIRPVEIKTGFSSGSLTEIISDDLHEGDSLISGTRVEAKNADSSSGADKSPFLPSMPKRPGSGAKTK